MIVQLQHTLWLLFLSLLMPVVSMYTQSELIEHSLSNPNPKDQPFYLHARNTMEDGRPWDNTLVPCDFRDGYYAFYDATADTKRSLNAKPHVYFRSATQKKVRWFVEGSSSTGYLLMLHRPRGKTKHQQARGIALGIERSRTCAELYYGECQSPSSWNYIPRLTEVKYAQRFSLWCSPDYSHNHSKVEFKLVYAQIWNSRYWLERIVEVNTHHAISLKLAESASEDAAPLYMRALE